MSESCLEWRRSRRFELPIVEFELMTEGICDVCFAAPIGLSNKKPANDQESEERSSPAVVRTRRMHPILWSALRFSPLVDPEEHLLRVLNVLGRIRQVAEEIPRHVEAGE
jgi:hypothetical protein